MAFVLQAVQPGFYSNGISAVKPKFFIAQNGSLESLGIFDPQRTMAFEPSPTTPLSEQLSQLEDLYAEYLTTEADARQLAELWKQIKVLRAQLNVPVYDYVTPKDQRQ